MYFIYFVALMRGCGRKNAKPENSKRNCSSCGGRSKKKRATMQKMERWVRRGFKCSGNKKKQIGNGQRPSGMGEDCVGSQGPQRTLTLEEKKRQKNAWILSRVVFWSAAPTVSLSWSPLIYMYFSPYLCCIAYFTLLGFVILLISVEDK